MENWAHAIALGFHGPGVLVDEPPVVMLESLPFPDLSADPIVQKERCRYAWQRSI
jgi:hypothetical protein